MRTYNRLSLHISPVYYINTPTIPHGASQGPSSSSAAYTSSISLMPPKVQFVILTGKPSSATKKEQRRLIQSHVTSQRYSEKRKRDVKNHELEVQRGSTSASPSTTSKSTSPVSPGSERIANILAGEPEISESWNDDFNTIVSHLDQSTIIQLSGTDNLPVFGDSRHEHSDIHVLPTLSPSPYAYIGNGLSDPFVSLPALKFPRMSKHLFYYVNILMPAMHPSYTTNLSRRTFGCKSMQYADELSLSGMSAFSATSRAMETGDLVRQDVKNPNLDEGFHENVFDWLYFKGNTIRLVNKRLVNGGEAIDDLTIGGICDLILLETYTGNIKEAKLHMNGLGRIASLRYKGDPLPYSIAIRITASAVKLSTLTYSTPPIPFTLTYVPGLSLPLPAISQLLPGFGSRLTLLWSHIEPSMTFLPTIHDIIAATRCTEAVYHWIYPYAEDDRYYEYINFQNLSIEHRTLGWKMHDDINSDIRIRQDCLRFALLLYANTGLIRGYPACAALIHNLVVGMRDSLARKAGNLEIWAGLEEVLLWIVFIGVHCSKGEAEEGFFLGMFREVVNAIGYDGVGTIRTALESLFWVDRIHESSLNEAWYG
ncbi:hypothetical protein B0J11DRAFT_540377 [Dendryphion nanum]|uniref:Tachykinin family protein n=1 Tax=Dendryphion nanum TaxID=256645 RepID=A0A9P9D7W0_9PLEO|nr:hypothetical protein B0J11DRAFT_540377 [Dendryphion nanum]